MTYHSTFVFRFLLLCCITRLSVDGMGLGNGALFMEHDVENKPKAHDERLLLNPNAKKVLDGVINLGREIVKGMERVVLDQKYELTASDMDQLHDCYYFKYYRNWNGLISNAAQLTQQEAFCKRLIEFKPSYDESTAYGLDLGEAHRFEAMSTAFKNFYPITPFYPTRQEMQEMEECFFSRPQDQKNAINSAQLSASEAFCQRLQTDVLNKTTLHLTNGAFYPVGLYNNYWQNLTLVAREDYAQILQCYSKMFSQRYSGPCKGYFDLIYKPTTVRDFRRKHVDACMRMKMRNPKTWTEHKDRCLKMIAQYKRVYCGFNE